MIYGYWQDGELLADRDELEENDPQVDEMYAAVARVQACAQEAYKKGQDAVQGQRLDNTLKQGVGQRAYAATSLRRLFPKDSSPLLPGGIVDRIERRPKQRRPTCEKAALAAANATWSC